MPSARWHRIRRDYFGTLVQSVITLGCLALLVALALPFMRWAIVDAVWTGSPESCRGQRGACWAFVNEKLGMSVFGLYPYEERWRPTLMLMIFVGMVAVSTQRRLWSRWLVFAWILVAPLLFVLMKGSVFGLPEVSTRLWGGLTVTVFVAVFGLATGYPLAVLLALGRRSRRQSIRWPCVALIEFVRGVPLISLIFMAAVMTPLFLPRGVEIDRLFRVQLAFTLFSAAYLAEVIRGGLSALDPGQEEAAKSLGLGYWRRMRLVVLPQALKMTIPSQVNTFIILLKDTTLVVIVGIFDFFTTLRAAMADPRWVSVAVETYLYAAAVYFVICFAMSRYSQFLERDLRPELAGRTAD